MPNRISQNGQPFPKGRLEGQFIEAVYAHDRSSGLAAAAIRLLEFPDKGPETVCPAGLLARLEMQDKVTTDAAEHFADGHWYQVMKFRGDMVLHQQLTQVFEATEPPALEWINVKRFGSLKAANKKMTREPNWLKVNPKALPNKDINR